MKSSKKADIVAVAKAAKVSASTVSRCFNHPDMVNPATRKKVDNAVRRLGYIRNRAAQTIHGIRSGTVGLVVPTIDQAIFSEVIQAFTETTDAEGFTILVGTHGYDLGREYALVRKLLEHRVDGLALVGLDHSEETYGLIERQEIPATLLWNYAPKTRLPCVGADNVEAGRIIARHMLDLGHRDIALLFPPVKDNDRASDRFVGVTDVLAQAGITVPDDWAVQSLYSITEAKRVALTLLQGARKPTAVICGNDVLAWGMLNAARALKIDVPRDLAISGIGDFKGSKDIEPALTTVRVPARQIGHAGALQIVAAITQPDVALKNENLPVELMARATSLRE